MPLTPFTAIHRFVSIGGRRIALVMRYKTDGSYSDAPAHKDDEETWGTYNESEPDRILEHGSLQKTLSEIAEQTQILAAATASPIQFADMVSAAHNLGRVIAVASIGRLAMGDRFADPTRFTKALVVGQTLEFFTFRTLQLVGKQSFTPGVYRNGFCLRTFNVVDHGLAEPDPANST